MAAEIVSLDRFRAGRADGNYRENSTGSLHKRRLDRRMRVRAGAQETDRRRDPRHLANGSNMPTICLGGKSLMVKNLSRNGLLATGHGSVVPHRLLIRLTGGRLLSARVVWKREGLIGLEVPLGRIGLHLL